MKYLQFGFISTATSTCEFTRNQNVQSFGATQSPSSSGQAACEARCRSEVRNSASWKGQSSLELPSESALVQFDIDM